MKELLEQVSRISQGNPTISWTVLILFCAAVILIWKILESLAPKGIESLLKYLWSLQSRWNRDRGQELRIREFLANSLPTNSLACIPVISKYHADFPLDDIYEPLSFDLTSETDQQNSVGMERILAQYQSFALIGRPGSGKTTLVNVMAIAYARDWVEKLFGVKESRLPLLLRLKDFTSPKPLPFLLAEPLNATGCSITPEFIEKQLQIGRCIVFLDGLDETPRKLRKAEIVPWIQNSMAQYSKNRFVISSRGPEWDEARVARLPRLTILDLSWPQIRSLIEKWESRMRKNIQDRQGQTKKKPIGLFQVLEQLGSQEVRELAKNPLLLTLMIILNENGIAIPIRKHDVYSTFIKVLLGEWEESKNVTFPGFLESHEIQSRLSFFGELSLFLLRNKFDNIDLTVPEIFEKCEELQAKLFSKPTTTVKDLLDRVSRRSGLIVQSTENSYSFVVRGFFEFLAAYALAASDKFYLALSQLTDPIWTETDLHYAALVHNPEEFLEKLKD